MISFKNIFRSFEHSRCMIQQHLFIIYECTRLSCQEKQLFRMRACEMKLTRRIKDPVFDRRTGENEIFVILFNKLEWCLERNLEISARSRLIKAVCWNETAWDRCNLERDRFIRVTQKLWTYLFECLKGTMSLLRPTHIL